MPIKKYNFKNYLWTIPFLSFLLGYITIQQIFQPKSFNTPSIVGKKLQQAISILSKNQLNIKFIAEKEDDSMPHGTILSQKPVAGLKITPNQSVYVTISKKPDKSACPELFNKNITDLTQTLKDKNLNNRSYYLPSNLPCNSCIAQYPLPGVSVKDTCIVTYVSNGSKKPVIFPNFKNKKLPDVLDFLENHNIKIKVIYSNDPNFAGQKKRKKVMGQEFGKQEEGDGTSENQNSQTSQNAQEAQTQDQKPAQACVTQEVGAQNQNAQEARNSQENTQNSQATKTQDSQDSQENKAQEANTQEAQANQDLLNAQETKTQESQDSQENKAQEANTQEAQANQDSQYNTQETQDLTVIDQRPLAGSLVNLDPSKPITVHLKVFKR